MRSKLLIPFLLGLVIILFVGSLFSVQERTTDSMAPPKIEPTLDSETPQSNPEKFKAEDVIEKALGELSKGQVYHNVPEQMQVGVSEIIEAGIAPEVTEKIKKELQGKGVIQTQSGVAYDPSGVEMKLIVKKDEFDVFELKGGKQIVIAKNPGKWIWEVTPLKSGDNLLIVKAIVEVKIPKLKVTNPVEVVVFSATRKVDVNFGYSIKKFVSTNWKEVLALVFGSGSVAGFVTWWISRKDKKINES